MQEGENIHYKSIEERIYLLLQSESFIVNEKTNSKNIDDIFKKYNKHILNEIQRLIIFELGNKTTLFIIPHIKTTIITSTLFNKKINLYILFIKKRLKEKLKEK